MVVIDVGDILTRPLAIPSKPILRNGKREEMFGSAKNFRSIKGPFNSLHDLR